MSRPRLVALALAGVTLVVFLPVARFGFINLDDIDYVIRNRFVTHGLNWTDVSWAFTAFHSGNWHPLTWISHMSDCQFFGLSPRAPHVINAFWHAANAGVLFLWLNRLTGKTGPALFVAALFAWHPLHVESVAWISERKDVLSTFFALLSLMAYTHYAQEKKGSAFWLALLFFAFGLLAKPMLVTLPCVLLLLDYWPLQRLVSLKPVLVEKIPFFALTLASCVITFFAQRNEAVVSLASTPLIFRFENASIAMTSYLLKFFAPVNLCILYPLHNPLAFWKVISSAIIIAGITTVAWLGRRQRPAALMGWLWFVGTLVPVIGLVQVGVQSMADRYTYIPSIGFFIALVFPLADWLEKRTVPPGACRAFAVALGLACIVTTEYQLQFWRSSEILFGHAIAVTHDNAVAHFCLGDALAEEGKNQQALQEFQTAARLQDGYQTWNRMGNVLEDEDRTGEAAAAYQHAISLNARVPDVHNSLGKVLLTLGRLPAAQQEFSMAARLDPGYPWPHVGFAKIQLAQGRDLDALAELHNALELQPDNFQILAYTARVLASDENPVVRDGRTAGALALQALKLAPHQSSTFDATGMAFAELGDFNNAQACAQNALGLALTAHSSETNQIRLHLEMYKNRQPWRESFRATNIPAAFK